jgi:mRNA interferase MazF
MVINQGDIFWINLDEPSGSEPGYRHPHVVIQNNLFNRSLINTVVVCALTSNLKRANAPGNVLLNKGEANLPKKSVINISQIFTVNKSDLSEKIGSLTRDRFSQVYEGIKLFAEPRDVGDIQKAITYYEDPHEMVGKVDFSRNARTIGERNRMESECGIIEISY